MASGSGWGGGKNDWRAKDKRMRTITGFEWTKRPRTAGKGSPSAAKKRSNSATSFANRRIRA